MKPTTKKPAPKPKKRRTPFNAFDAEPKSKTMQRNSHKAALAYITSVSGRRPTPQD